MYNDRSQKQIRKTLRKSLTPQEILLWSRLKGRQLGYKFRRQFSVGPYILDFYCPEKRVAVEIDGSQHQGNQGYDKTRMHFLVSQDIATLRFWNNEVNTNLDGVIQKIISLLNNTPQS